MRHRFLQFLSTAIRWLISSIVRTAITGLVFATCLMFTLNYLGVPVPGPHELIDKLDGLARLAEILS